MSNRKINITVKSSDSLKIIIEELGKSIKGELKLTMTLEDTKETMSYICRSPYILDWDYDSKSQESNIQDEAIKSELHNESLDLFEIVGIHEKNWNELTWIIESIWKLAQRSPSLIFGTRFFIDAVSDIYKEKLVTPEHVILAMIIEGYYKDFPLNEIKEDINSKLRDNWKSLNGITLSELATKLYK
jgi:hypothetical protein